MKMAQIALEIGTVVKIGGIPCRLVKNTVVQVNVGNLEQITNYVNPLFIEVVEVADPLEA